MESAEGGSEMTDGTRVEVRRGLCEATEDELVVEHDAACDEVLKVAEEVVEANRRFSVAQEKRARLAVQLAEVREKLGRVGE